MRMLPLLGGLFLAFCAQEMVRAEEIAIVPRPAHVEKRAGEGMKLTAETRIAIPPGDEEAASAARYLADLTKLAVTENSPRPGDIVFVDRAEGEAESYHLSVSERAVTISAKGGAGKFYGAVTLWQLMTQGALPAVEIEDAPRFPWRGLMLDSARHMQSPAYIKRYIDWMALHKLNLFHWHLTDDQGWRIEIKAFPRLTSVGALRRAAGPDRLEGKELYGGYYSQEQIRDIVAYAAERHVIILPEIDMPGHATAAVAAYPALGVPGFGVSAPTADWGLLPSLFNIDESAFGAVEIILDEVMALFPGSYIHIGGDEVSLDEWRESPMVQKRMKALGIADAEALRLYFVDRLQHILDKKGRRLVGWDEILHNGLGENAVVMSWRGREGAVAAARAGRDTVMAAWPGYYLDNRQSEAADEPPGWTQTLTLRDVYAVDPVPADLTPEQEKHLLGVQGQLWTERARTEEWVTRLTYPRAAAIAEAGWTPAEGRDWPDFLRRMTVQRERYRLIGLKDGGLGDEEKPAPVSPLVLCQKDEVGVVLEGNSPGSRYRVDYRNPCWRYPDIDLATARTVRLAVGQVPFTYRLGSANPTVPLPKSHTRWGEIAIHRDAADGPLLAEIPLQGLSPDRPSREFTALLPAAGGRHDLYFVVTGHEIDPRKPKVAPLTAIDWIDFDVSSPPGEGRGNGVGKFRQ